MTRRRDDGGPARGTQPSIGRRMSDGERQPSKRGSRLLRWLVVGFLVAIGTFVASARRFDRTIRRSVADLDSIARAPSADDYDRSQLPDPVDRYFEQVFEGQPDPIGSVHLQQRGEIRLGGEPGRWRPFVATQDCSVEPPGFVWDASVAVAPFLRARVLDCYANGEGRLRARIAGAIPVASAGPSPELSEGELFRYLAEAVWYPSALRPRPGLTWEAIDEAAARATLRDAHNTATLVFHFGADGLVECVTGERYRQESAATARWVGHFHDYADRDGRLVPTRVEVAWDGPEGEQPYFRATIEALDHRPPVGGR